MVIKMPQARNPREFEQYVNVVIKQMVEDITQQTLMELRDYVMEEWYLNRTPSEYDRTYQFLDSLIAKDIKRVTNVFIGEVLSDPKEIIPMWNDESMWNWHMSVDGEDYSELITHFIEEGQSSSLYSYGGIHMFQYTSNWVKKNLDRIAKQTFKKYGLNLVKN